MIVRDETDAVFSGYTFAGFAEGSSTDYLTFARIMGRLTPLKICP